MSQNVRVDLRPLGPFLRGYRRIRIMTPVLTAEGALAALEMWSAPGLLTYHVRETDKDTRVLCDATLETLAEIRKTYCPYGRENNHGWRIEEIQPDASR